MDKQKAQSEYFKLLRLGLLPNEYKSLNCYLHDPIQQQEFREKQKDYFRKAYGMKENRRDLAKNNKP